MRAEDLLILLRKAEKSYTFDAIITALGTGLDSFKVNIFAKGFYSLTGTLEPATHTNITAYDVTPGVRRYVDDQVKVYFLEDEIAIIKPYFEPTQKFISQAVVNKSNGDYAGYVRARKVRYDGVASTKEFLVAAKSAIQPSSIFFAHKPAGGTSLNPTPLKVATGEGAGSFPVGFVVEWQEIAGGIGLPPGGSQYQLLQKDSSADGDAIWFWVRGH